MSEKPSHLQRSRSSKNSTNCLSAHGGCCRSTCKEHCKEAAGAFLHLSDENTKAAATAAGRAQWGPLHSPFLQENSSHQYYELCDFLSEQLLPTAKGNFKPSHLLPISSVLCLSLPLGQTDAWTDRAGGWQLRIWD